MVKHSVILIAVLLVGLSYMGMGFPDEDDAAEAAAADRKQLVPSVVKSEAADQDEEGEGDADEEDVVAVPDGDRRTRAGLPEAEERGWHWHCKSGKCRRKCNAKGKNGACAGPVCVCWS